MATRAALAERRFLERQQRAEGRDRPAARREVQPAARSGGAPTAAERGRKLRAQQAADGTAARKLKQAVEDVEEAMRLRAAPTRWARAAAVSSERTVAARLPPAEEREFVQSVRKQIRRGAAQPDGRLHLESAPQHAGAAEREEDLVDAMLTSIQRQHAAYVTTLNSRKARLAEQTAKLETTTAIVRHLLPLMRASLPAGEAAEEGGGSALALPIAAVQALEEIDCAHLIDEWAGARSDDGSVAAARGYDAAEHAASVREMRELLAIAAEAEAIDAELGAEIDSGANAEAEETQLEELERLLLIKLASMGSVLPSPSLAFESVAPGGGAARRKRERAEEAATAAALAASEAARLEEAARVAAPSRRAEDAHRAAAAAAARVPEPALILERPTTAAPRTPAPAAALRNAPGSASLALLQQLDDSDEDDAAAARGADAALSKSPSAALADIFEAHPALAARDEARAADQAATDAALLGALAAEEGGAPLAQQCARVHINRRGSISVTRADGTELYVRHDGNSVLTRGLAPSASPSSPPLPRLSGGVPPRPAALPAPRASSRWTDPDPEWRADNEEGKVAGVGVGGAFPPSEYGSEWDGSAPGVRKLDALEADAAAHSAAVQTAAAEGGGGDASLPPGLRSDAAFNAESAVYDDLIFESVVPEAAGPPSEWLDEAPRDTRVYRSVMPGTTRQKTLLGTCLRQVVEDVLMASTDRERLCVTCVCPCACFTHARSLVVPPFARSLRRPLFVCLLSFPCVRLFLPNGYTQVLLRRAPSPYGQRCRTRPQVGGGCRHRRPERRGLAVLARRNGRCGG